jgi:four helix bundle protein
MILPLNHKKLEVYRISRLLVKECYTITSILPAEERFNLTTQIRRAALSVKLNIAEGSSRKSPNERKRYYEISRGSLIEIDAAIETAFDLSYLTKEQITSLSLHLNQCFALLSGLIK